MAKKSFKAWTLKEPRGNIINYTHSTRKEAICSLVQGPSCDKLDRAKKWREAYKYGWRAVRVLVTEI